MAWLLYLLEFTLIITAVILIILVLLQKGKGGGLAGALGGMGGQSAFGTKAGDLFTKITMVVAGIWILLCVIAAMAAPHLAGGDQLNVQQIPGQQQQSAPASPSGEQPAGGATKPDSSGKPVAPSTPEKPGTVPEPSSKPSENPAK